MELEPFQHTEQPDLYRFGIDTIIAGVVQYASPFHLLSAVFVQETKGAMRDGSANVCQHGFNQFLSSFFTFSAKFVEIVSERLADTIRRNTTRPDIRAQTTASLANAIRNESFAEILTILRDYANSASRLGIALQSTSTLNHVLGGAFVGGGTELLLTDGHHSAAGTIAGAIVGGVIAENKKQGLRQAAWESAIENVRNLTGRVGFLPARLMDQYVSYVFGETADFTKRDEEINCGKAITSEIASACSTIFDHVLILNGHVSELGRLSVTTCDFFEIPFLPANRRKRKALITEWSYRTSKWHLYLANLQDNCTAGLTETVRGTSSVPPRII